MRIWLAVAVVFVLSGGLFAALTIWTDHTLAATRARSHAFAHQAKSICEHASHTAAGVEQAAVKLAALPEPPNVHRAVARLVLHWRRLATASSAKAYRSQLKQARLSAHLLNVKACTKVKPR